MVTDSDTPAVISSVITTEWRPAATGRVRLFDTPVDVVKRGGDGCRGRRHPERQRMLRHRDGRRAKAGEPEAGIRAREVNRLAKAVDDELGRRGLLHRQ